MYQSYDNIPSLLLCIASSNFAFHIWMVFNASYLQTVDQ